MQIDEVLTTHMPLRYDAVMVDVTSFAIPRVRRANVQAPPLPKPQPFGAPVFINDCVTPLCGETVLSLLLKRMMQQDNLDQ